MHQIAVACHSLDLQRKELMLALLSFLDIERPKADRACACVQAQ